MPIFNVCLRESLINLQYVYPKNMDKLHIDAFKHKTPAIGIYFFIVYLYYYIKTSVSLRIYFLCCTFNIINTSYIFAAQYYLCVSNHQTLLIHKKQPVTKLQLCALFPVIKAMFEIYLAVC